MGRTETVAGVIRGNLGSIWGRFRPSSGMSAGEIKAAEAERRAYGARLSDALSDVKGDQSKIVRELRGVFHDLEGEPITNAMPTEDELAGRVRARVEKHTVHAWCPACAHNGGAPGAYSDSTPRQRSRGDLPVGGDWWCDRCYPALSWFANRQERYLDGREFPYPPPPSLFPKAAFEVGAGPEAFVEFTDGVLVTPLAAYVRDYLESLSGRAILDAPCLTPLS